ncbi:uncharacterized protein METZ01_LOCUS319432, partial [marine metagenome]
MLINLGLIFISLVLLYYGGEFLVSGSLRLAQSLKLSPFIIGATVMGFGTSVPELAVSVIASLHGSGELALGNIIGSNIANIGLVLGLTTLIIPLTIEKSRFENESPSLIITSLIIVIFAWDTYVSRIEGITLISLLFIYLWKAFRIKETIEIDLTQEYLFQGQKRPIFHIFLVVLGIIMLVAGANWMVEGASSIARKLG